MGRHPRRPSSRWPAASRRGRRTTRLAKRRLWAVALERVRLPWARTVEVRPSAPTIRPHPRVALGAARVDRDRPSRPGGHRDPARATPVLRPRRPRLDRASARHAAGCPTHKPPGTPGTASTSSRVRASATSGKKLLVVPGRPGSAKSSPAPSRMSRFRAAAPRPRPTDACTRRGPGPRSRAAAQVP